MYHAVYLRNRLPTKALGGRVPMQQLTGSMPDLTHLRMYGCKAFVKVDDKSLDSTAREAVYIGHSDLSNSFRVLVRGAKGRWDIVDTIEEEEEEEGGITGNYPSALLCGRKVSYHLTHSTAFLL
jgi:hypothetical protein